MDKSWIGMPRNTPEYVIGLNQFLNFAFNNGAIGDKIKCPCHKYGFRKWQTRKIVFNHLIDKPFPQNYVTWFMHGEMNVLHNSRDIEVAQDAPPMENPVELLINEAFGGLRHEGVDVGPSQVMGEEEMLHDMPASNNQDFFELLRDGHQELYEGSKYSKLKFLLKLYHIKCLSGLSDNGMTMILDLLRDAFKFVKIPDSFYEAKKTIKKLCLDYIKIDACPNDCMLYWEDDVNAETCKYCHTSRWKPENESNKDHAPTTSKKQKKKRKKPAKILRYFPLKPRLQRLFMCSKIAEHMSWHAEDGNKDGTIRHPRDGEAWKRFDTTFPEFASDPRNVRLGLASDGFNPFGTMSTNYSIWPQVLVPYNLLPWLCMKQPNFILSMIIRGPRTAGNNIDVYLQPLIKELNELWSEGVDTFDSSKDEMFRMRAALMWTVSNFPGLDILSGWNTHTGLACPSCNFDAKPCRLRHSRKWCFIGHHRFLGRNHKFRMMRPRFDGNVEERTPPKKLSGSDILQQVKDINVTFGRQAELNDKRKQSRKRSVGEEKSKDHVKARRDLQDMGIRRDLWPDENDECRLGAFTIPMEKKVTFLKTLKNISFARWLFKLLGHLKSLVGNKSQPEGSIAEGYIVEEALTLYSRYFEGIESRLNRPKRVNDEPNCNEASEKSSMFPQQGKPVGGSTTEPLTLLEKTQAHRYVLLNCATVKPFVDEFRHHIRRSRAKTFGMGEVERRVSKEFPDWFPKRIMNPDIADTISDDLKFLTQGPAQDAKRFSAYNINGFKFRTLSREQGSKTQNSGVFLVSDISCVASSADRYARQADLPYYGRLEDIIELNYYGRFRVVLFKCRWPTLLETRGFKSDVWKFNCVNFSKLIHTGDREDDDPYIEAS
ncbi:uncharacterized protein LOC132046198 [Lycium ferocissimum]|uniref:uncharacterized protein LOC132046198 n=1 Tax=Lycium ferocissimum TaxID=112874 RepID=UPI0028153D9A|nr:uncharacterized protein LOC132046198 [Lycium ferocissimum]